MTVYSAWRSWWLTPLPLARIAWLRTVLYLFVLYDATFLVNVVPHGSVPAELYQPVLLPRVLGHPAPTPLWVHTLQIVLVTSAAVAATGRFPRLAGWTVALAYLDWQLIAMSYGKIDHDKLALLVAVWVLPTVGAARFRDRVWSEAAGFAIRSIQVAVVATYFLAAWAKMRWGGWGWANGATFTWAMSRRGTGIGRLLLEYPQLLRLSQWGVLAAEVVSPLLLVLRGRLLAAGLLFFGCFHLVTWLTIRIHFLPTVVCLVAFVPLERIPELAGRLRRRVARRRATRSTRAHRIGVSRTEGTS
jgi:hypothetical protein